MMLAAASTNGSKGDMARAHLEAARAFRPEALEPLVKLADLARGKDRPTEEKALLLEALAIDGESFEPAARLLMLAEATGDYATAQKALRRARAAAPLHPLALAGQALSEDRQGQSEAAHEWVARAVAGLDGREHGPVDTLAII